MKCSSCYGYAATAAEVADCFACLNGERPCPLHACAMCDGSGLVCPYCHGMRFVRVREWDATRGGSIPIEPCRRCCEGNQVNPAKERRVIDDYLREWHIAHMGVIAEEDPEDVRKREVAEYQAAWQAQHGPNRFARRRRQRAEQPDGVVVEGTAVVADLPDVTTIEPIPPNELLALAPRPMPRNRKQVKR